MRRVIKVGGSLLTREDLQTRLPQRLQEIADQGRLGSEPVETWLVVGGGQLVNAIRELDRLRPLDPTATHWRCIELLHHTLDIVGQWFPEWSRIESRQDFHGALQQAGRRSVPTLVAVRSFYAPGDSGGLPHDWRTTSDSLAGKLADDIAAEELVLLKSCAIDPTWGVAEMIERGVIDSAFATFDDVAWKLRVVSY
ncbi:MAG: hypothetical protein ACF788_07320 [Novipirellula sp. JB048]